MIEVVPVPLIDVSFAPPARLHLMEIWGDADAVSTRVEAQCGASLPTACRSIALTDARVVWWEPKTWLIRVEADQASSGLGRWTDAVGGEGAFIEVSGAFTRLRLAGPGWRELLMIGGVFDAEAPLFAEGSVAGTVIHHLPVRIDVVNLLTIDVYTPPSYSADLMSYWRRSAARLNAQRPSLQPRS